MPTRQPRRPFMSLFLLIARRAGAVLALVVLPALAPPAPRVAAAPAAHSMASTQLNAVISGIVQDAQTGRPVANADIAAPGAHTLSDQHGHYSLIVPSNPRIRLQITALGFQWGPPFIVTRGDHLPVVGDVTVNFTGSMGLQQAFRDSTGDTLIPFSQIVPAGTRGITMTVHTLQSIAPAIAVTDPHGNAVLLPLIQQGAVSTGRILFTAGSGVYEIEINSLAGTSLFDLPIYVGVPYTPPGTPPVYPLDDPNASSAQLETQALTLLNQARVAHGIPPIIMDPRLEVAARAHSNDIVQHGYFYTHPHIGSDGSTPAARIGAAGVIMITADEDVAVNSSLQAALDDMMISPTHHAALFSSSFTLTGIGVVRQGDGDMMVTIDLIRPVHMPTVTVPFTPQPAPLATPSAAPVVPANNAQAGPQTPAQLQVDASLTLPGLPGGHSHFSQTVMVVVPSGAVQDTTVLHVTAPLLASLPVTTASVGTPNNVGVGLAYALTASLLNSGQPVTHFNPTHAVLLQISYTPDDVSILDPSSLAIGFFNPTSKTWQSLATTVDPIHHLLTAHTTHFTLFQVRGTAHTLAQLKQAQSRLATLARAGAPRLHAVTLVPTSVAGVPIIITLPKSQQAPINLQLTGPAHALVHVAMTVARATTAQSFSLDDRGYSTIGLQPAISVTSPQVAQVSVSIVSGAFRQDLVQNVTLLPGYAAGPQPPSAPPLQVSLSAAQIRVGVAGPLLTIKTVAGATINLTVQKVGPPLSSISAFSSSIDASGILHIQMPRISATFMAPATGGHSPRLNLQVVVSVTLHGLTSQKIVTYSVTR